MAPHSPKSNNSLNVSSDVDVTSTPPRAEQLKAPNLTSKSKSTEKEPHLRDKLKRLRTHVINPIFKHQKSNVFREPVDAKALGIYPIYHQVIKRPMDLGTIRKKIDRGEYRTRAECVADIFLVWTNATTFNKPGHFVHEAALILDAVTKDKLEKLEKDEAAGVFDQPKEPKKKAAAADKVDAPKRDSPRPERRVARKVSQDLPGEHTWQPQQLKKRYVENLSEQLKVCDTILKELLSLKVHRAYVEPFLRVGRGKYPAAGDRGELMDLYKVQQRLQNDCYRHPVQFANDVRRIVTECYRYCQPEDPLVSLASNLQHNFELLFARVVYETVDPRFLSGVSEDDTFIAQCQSMQTLVGDIKTNVDGLVRDYVVTRGNNNNNNKKSKSANANKRRRPRAPNNKASAKQGSSPNKKKRGRPTAAANTKPAAAAAAAGGGPPAPTGTISEGVAAAAAKNKLSPEESLHLRGEVAKLNEDQQQHVVQIMIDNGEPLSQDANGYTEIDLGNCSDKTVRQIQAYIKKCKKPNNNHSSPTKATATPTTANKPDSSSDSSSSDESSSDDDSSSDESDEDSD